MHTDLVKAIMLKGELDLLTIIPEEEIVPYGIPFLKERFKAIVLPEKV
jgi:hypothetical protein